MRTPIWIQILAILKRFYIKLRENPISSVFSFLIWPGFCITVAIVILLKDGTTKNLEIKVQISYVLMILLTGYATKYYGELVVKERTCGFKSLMLLMGLRRLSYYLAHSICYTLCLFPVILTSFLISKLSTFIDCSTINLILFFSILTFQFISQMFVYVSIITSIDYISFITFLSMLQLLIHYLVVLLMDTLGQGSYSLILFISSMFPYESYRLFQDSYLSCKDHCNEINLDTEKSLVSMPLATLLIYMTFWSIFGLLFSRWLEEVNPWQTDSAIKGPLFFIKAFFKNRNKSNYLDDVELNPQYKSKYFEEINTTNREIGIKIQKLSKSFNKNNNKLAVDDINFDVFKGETTLLLGHNGAGKTTLMNIIIGKLAQTNGQVTFRSKYDNNNYQYSEERKGNVGICPQFSILDDSLTVREHLEFFIDIKAGDMCKADRLKHIEETLFDVSLGDEIDKKPTQLSGGMKRKLSLAIAFIGQSDILILDEPSSGLDPDSRIYVWNAIRKYRLNRTVLLSTQHMEEADYLGDRIAIMADGKIICCGSSVFLINTLGNWYKLRIECSKSNEENVLALIREYFPRAEIVSTISTSSSLSFQLNSLVNLVIELKGDIETNLNENLIKLLEYLESFNKESLKTKFGIESYSLKSSSVDDVMINTSKIEDINQDNPDGNEANNLRDFNSTLKLNITTTNESINTILSTPSVGPYSTDDNFIKLQLNLLKALLIKQAQVFRNDLLLITIPKFLSGLIAILYTNCLFLDPFISSRFQQNFFICNLIIHFIHYPTQERISKFKIIQLTSKLNVSIYWLSFLIVDMLYISIMIIMNNLIFSLLFHGKFISSPSMVHLIISTATFFFGLSAAILAYYLSTFINDIKKAPGIHLMFYWMGGITSLIVNVASIIISMKLFSLHSITDNIFIFIIPGDAYQAIMSGLVAECYIGKSYGEEECLNQLKVSRIFIGFLAFIIQIIVYGSLLYIKEYQDQNDEDNLLKRIKCFISKHELKSNVKNNTIIEKIDEDVLSESAKAAEAIDLIKRKQQQLNISNVNVDGLVLIANKLNKSYKRGVKVIDDLSFTVNRGECFGLLGINGAGKSTTFSMLLNDELSHDSGELSILSSFVAKEYRKQLGYTPQTNIDTVMTPSQLLQLMARLRFIHQDDNVIKKLVSALIDLLQMEEHADKKFKELSGGTKRKLILGMSLIGNQEFVLLDEPTAGVDPVAKSDIWSLLGALKKQNNSTVLISSHAMEECEAICDRIAIMASGKLRCIGTFLQLRTKFSQASRIRIQVSKSDNDHVDLEVFVKDVVVKELSYLFQTNFNDQIKLVDTNVNSATFNITNGYNMKRSVLFKLLTDFKEKHKNVHYMFNDSSLEDIFIAIAQEQKNKFNG